MIEPIYKEAQIDIRATLEALEVGDYAYKPESSGDISAIRAAVCRVAKDMEPKSFAVHKTLNGWRIDRTA